MWNNDHISVIKLQWNRPHINDALSCTVHQQGYGKPKAFIAAQGNYGIFFSTHLYKFGNIYD